MCARRLLSPVIGVSLMLLASTALANSLQDMANIMMGLDHRPSAAEKQTLKAIIDNSASKPWERTIATAIMNLEHHATAADRQKLEGLMQDDSVPADARELAGIVANINHHPSAEDKEELRKMLE